MSTNPEQKHWGRVVAIILGAGLLILVPLILVANHMINAANTRARIAGNELAAIDTLDLIGAAEQIHLDAYGQYGTLRQLVEADILHLQFNGAPPVYKGYAFTVMVTSPNGMQPAFFSVNADPVRDLAGEATGQRHFYRESNVTGIRFREDRPANQADALLPRVIEAY